jgi:rhodanese-related sulfurtransferase
MENITAEELRSRLQTGEEVHLVDVREPDEHIEFNIGGILLPLGKIQGMETDEIDAFRNQELIFYCRSGNRSLQACLYLEMMGFTNVKNLAGGMVEWRSLS